MIIFTGKTGKKHERMDFVDLKTKPRSLEDFDTDESLAMSDWSAEKFLSSSELIGLQIQLGANLSTDLH